MKILITDDSQFMRNVVKDALADAGYDIVEASNGQEALAAIKDESPDLVLLDIIMPELDGIGVLKEIGQQQKVVVISAVGQEKMVDEAKQLGAIDYITKPFENDKVVATVKKALGKD